MSSVAEVAIVDELRTIELAEQAAVDGRYDDIPVVALLKLSEEIACMPGCAKWAKLAQDLAARAVWAGAVGT